MSCVCVWGGGVGGGEWEEGLGIEEIKQRVPNTAHIHSSGTNSGMPIYGQ